MAPVHGRDTGPQPDYSILQCHGRSALMVAVHTNGTRSPRSKLQHCIHSYNPLIQSCNIWAQTSGAITMDCHYFQTICKRCPDTVQLRPKWLPVTPGAQRKKWGLGGYADAKLCLRGLRLAGRARRCKWCLNTVELCPNVLQVTPGAHLKKWGLGGYADAKLRFRGLHWAKQGLRESNLPEYDGTLPEVIASHTWRPAQKVGFGRICGC